MSRQFAIIPERATFDRRVTPAMYRMLGALGSYATKEGWCWTKLSTLATRLEQTEGAVSKMIGKLIDAAYVEMHYETRKGRRCCVYRVLYDRPPATVAQISDEELEGADEAGDSQPPLSSTESLNENAAPPSLDVRESQPPARVSLTSSQRPERQVSTFPQEASVLLRSGVVEHGTTSPPPSPLRWHGLRDRAAGLSSGHAHALTDTLQRIAALGDHRANALAAELEAIESGMHGHAATLEVIAQALHEMAVAGAELRPALIRAFVRRAREGEPPPRPAAARRDRPETRSELFAVGGQQLAAPDFWRLCTDGGLTSPMQSPETIRESVGRLHARGLVTDPEAFTQLVLHVDPAQLAEIKFRPEQEAQLRGRLASWRPGRAA